MSANPKMLRLPPMPKISDLLRVYGLTAKKQLSQNFILDLNVTGWFALFLFLLNTLRRERPVCKKRRIWCVCVSGTRQRNATTVPYARSLLMINSNDRRFDTYTIVYNHVHHLIAVQDGQSALWCDTVRSHIHVFSIYGDAMMALTSRTADFSSISI